MSRIKELGGYGDFGLVESDPFDVGIQEEDESLAFDDVPLSPLTDNQEILLSVLQILSALLSLTGSSLIVYKILRKLNKTKKTTPYERIILGLSTFDILSSATYGLAPFLLDSETSQRVWAIGTKNTCSFLGFMSQLCCFWAIWYNVVLSFYYLITVRFGVKPDVFVKKYELFLHLTGAVFFPITSLMGLMGDWYGEEQLAMICWIGDVPRNCSADDVTCYTQLVAYIFGMLPTAICFFSLIVNNTVIYLFVRKNLRVETPKGGWKAGLNNEDSTDNYRVSSASITPEQEDVDEQRRMLQKRLSREVAVQSFLYVAAFMVTIVPAILISVLDALGYNEDTQDTLYPLLISISVFVPLQGLFNVFIYVKPSYSRFRNKNPDDPKLAILKQALFKSEIPRYSENPTPTRSLKRTGKDSKGSRRGGSMKSNLESIPEEAFSE